MLWLDHDRLLMTRGVAQTMSEKWRCYKSLNLKLRGPKHDKVSYIELYQCRLMQATPPTLLFPVDCALSHSGPSALKCCSTHGCASVCAQLSVMLLPREVPCSRHRCACFVSANRTYRIVPHRAAAPPRSRERFLQQAAVAKHPGKRASQCSKAFAAFTSEGGSGTLSGSAWA